MSNIIIYISICKHNHNKYLSRTIIMIKFNIQIKKKEKEKLYNVTFPYATLVTDQLYIIHVTGFMNCYVVC